MDMGPLQFAVGAARINRRNAEAMKGSMCREAYEQGIRFAEHWEQQARNLLSSVSA
jgi:hypothetical protein